MAPLSFADSLREWRDLVVRHPDRHRIHPRLKPWLSVVGVKGPRQDPILYQEYLLIVGDTRQIGSVRNGQIKANLVILALSRKIL